MTSSPPSSCVSKAVWTGFPASPAGNCPKGLRSLVDLTKHLTARTDDSHAAPVQDPRRKATFIARAPACQAQVRFFALHRIKPHAPLLVRAPNPPTPSVHRLGSGLPGYLILFAPPTFAPQRQYRSSGPPSPPVFCRISTHFTATPCIPATSPGLQRCSFGRTFRVEPGAFTSDTQRRLRALYAQ